jgi:hypothetical protein
MMIEKYPAALQHEVHFDNKLPIGIECSHPCRLPIISKCMELYPEGLNRHAITMILSKVNKSDFRSFYPILSIVFTADPMRLYPDPFFGFRVHDIIHDPYHRLPIFNLLPRHVFTPRHELDYRYLNWQPRAAMMMLLSQMKIQQQTSSLSHVGKLDESLIDTRPRGFHNSAVSDYACTSVAMFVVLVNCRCR